MLKNIKKYRAPYLFILPFFILFFLFQLIPTIWTFYISFTEWKGIGDPVWCGTDNYQKILIDNLFWESLVNTVVYWITGMVLILVLAVIIASLLNSSSLNHKSFFKTVTFLPNICAAIAMGLIFRMLFDENTGLINEFLGMFGVGSVGWLTDTRYSKIPVILLNVWRNTPWFGTVTTLYFCALAGFAFAKFRFPGRNFLFYFVIATMLIPPEVGAVPLFILMKKFNLINSLWSLIIPRIATAVGIFYMHQYMSDIPDELIEAARVDGCTDFGIFTKIVLPVIKPALASWAAITLIARWNDFFWPLLYLRKSSKYTLMVTISLLPVSEGLSTPWPVILAGTTLVIIPIILLYLFLQRFQKSGMMAGAVKG